MSHNGLQGAAHADDSDKVGTPYYRSPEQESGKISKLSGSSPALA